MPENIPDVEQHAGLLICLILFQYSFPFSNEKKVYFVAMDCSTWFALLILKQAFLVLQLLAALWSSVWVPSYEMHNFLHTDCDRLVKDNVQKTHFNQHVRVTDWSWSSQYWNWHKSERLKILKICASNIWFTSFLFHMKLLYFTE